MVTFALEAPHILHKLTQLLRNRGVNPLDGAGGGAPNIWTCPVVCPRWPGEMSIRYDTIDDLHCKTDRKAASLI